MKTSNRERNVEKFHSLGPLGAPPPPRMSLCTAFRTRFDHNSFFLGFGKGVFGQRGLFRKVHFLEILENLEIREILENPQTAEKKGESDHFLETLENLEILEILEIPPTKRPLS